MPDKNGCSQLILQLPTDGTVEAMNAIPSIPIATTIYSDNLDSQQNIVVNTGNIKRDMEVLNGTGSLRHRRLCYNQCFSVISIFSELANSFLLQHKQA